MNNTNTNSRKLFNNTLLSCYGAVLIVDHILINLFEHSRIRNDNFTPKSILREVSRFASKNYSSMLAKSKNNKKYYYSADLLDNVAYSLSYLENSIEARFDKNLSKKKM